MQEVWIRYYEADLKLTLISQMKLLLEPDNIRLDISS